MRRAIYVLAVCIFLVCTTHGPVRADADDALVRIRLETTDVGGNPIGQMNVGGTFQLRGFVQDIRVASPLGVFGAFTDVTYNPALASVAGPLVFGPDYVNLQTGNTATPGLLDEVGAIDGSNPLGASERLLFLLPFQATASGLATFSADPADLLPTHDVLLYGLDQPIPSSQVEYGSASLLISSLPTISISDSSLFQPSAGSSLMQFTVSLSSPSSEAILVNFATASGSATSGVDYASSAGTLSFLPNTTSMNIGVLINSDSEVEPNESFFVNLSNPTTNATISDGVAVGTILVPEPASVALAALGASMLITACGSRRQRRTTRFESATHPG